MAVIVSKGIVVPKKVEFVEYIESTGTQYIDMGFKPNQDTRIEITAELVSTTTSSGNIMLFGARSSGSAEFFVYYYPSSYHLYGRYAATQVMQIQAVLTGKTSVISLNKNNLSVDGSLKSGSYAPFQCTHNAVLFGWNNEGVIGDFASMRLYSCQIYDNGTLVRDLWPCYNPKGVACMYDKVEKKYYYNAGTGEFIAGEAA